MLFGCDAGRCDAHSGERIHYDETMRSFPTYSHI